MIETIQILALAIFAMPTTIAIFLIAEELKGKL